MKTFARLCFFAMVALLPSCQNAPVTGRSQLVLLSLEQEMSLGADAYRQTLREERVIKRGPDTQRIREIGSRIAAVAVEEYPDPASRFRWEYNLIDAGETVNAFCLPGGKVAVYTGILDVADTDARLAAVMGHEIGHAIARHGGERVSQGLAFQFAMIGASIRLEDMQSGKRDRTLAALGIAGTVGVMLPFSRKHEEEADHIGLVLMAKAGYDPREAVQLWENMARLGGGGGPEWLSTHPSNRTRIQNLTRLLPSVMPFYREVSGE